MFGNFLKMANNAKLVPRKISTIKVECHQFPVNTLNILETTSLTKTKHNCKIIFRNLVEITMLLGACTEEGCAV